MKSIIKILTNDTAIILLLIWSWELLIPQAVSLLFSWVIKEAFLQTLGIME